MGYQQAADCYQMDQNCDKGSIKGESKVLNLINFVQRACGSE